MSKAVGLPSPHLRAAAAAGKSARRFVRPLALSLSGLSSLDLYIAREIIVPVTAIAAALGLLMLLERALVLLGEMNALGMQARFFFPLLLRLVPYYLMQAIPAAFVAALILVVGRMASDREWVVMSVAGVSPQRLVRPMMIVGLIVASATLAVSGWLEPIGRHGYRSMHALAVSESRLRALQSQAIYAPNRDVMLTADSVGIDGLQHVFLWLSGKGNTEIVATALSGRVETRESPAALDFELKNGELLSAGYRQAYFGLLRGTQLLGLDYAPSARGRDARELTLSELISRDRASPDRTVRQAREGEIYGRIARSLSILALPWIVLPLLLNSPARRRWLAVVIIIAMTVTFYHGVNFARNLAVNGTIDVWRAGLLTILLPVFTAVGVWHLGGAQRGFSSQQSLPDLQVFEHANRRTHPRHELSHYLGWRLFVMTAAVLTSLVLLFQLVDLFERGEVLVRSGSGLRGFAYYAWCKLPPTLLQAMPIATLGGAMMTWSRMRLTSELVVMHAAGISPFGILRRTLAVPLAIGVAMICIAEFWAPSSQVAFSQWWEKLAPQDPAVAAGERRWFRMGDEIVSAAMADPRGTALATPRIYRRDSAGRLTERVNAARADWINEQWQLRDAASWHLSSAGASLQPLAGSVWKTALQPPQVRQFFAAPLPLSGRHAWAAMNANVPADKPRALYETRLLMTFTIAAAPLVMLLLSVAVMVVGRRDKLLAWGLFQCLACGLSFLVLNGYCELLGLSGDMQAWLAVTAAPLLFAAIALELMFRAERQE